MNEELEKLRLVVQELDDENQHLRARIKELETDTDGIDRSIAGTIELLDAVLSA